MTLNRELFAEDPLKRSIPNDGVSKVGRPGDAQQWEVLRYELTSFVCKGEYERGLDRILSSYLSHLGQAGQPSVWVSGFYGSGKSHLVRVLEHMWADTAFPDGARARSLVGTSQAITDALTELTTAARRVGVNAWAASGNLGAEGVDQLGLAFLAIVQRAAGLPEKVAPARCALWLHREGVYDAVQADLASAGKTLESELRLLHLSQPLAQAVLAALPDQAPSPAELLSQFRAQFPDVGSLSTHETVEQLRGVLEHISGVPGTVPHTLVVLDEVQQYINDEGQKALAVQHLVEACASTFGAQLLVVGTGQSEMQATKTLQKIRDRFSVPIQLKNQDVDAVVRQVVLRKDPAGVAELEGVVQSAAASGEISRQLSGSAISHRDADNPDLVPDYPLLPTRRRFWEAVLRESDRAGKAGQLRSQLRVIHEANRSVAEKPVGTVVAADYIYVDKASDMHSSGVLLKEVQLLIEAERKQGADGELRARALSLVFLIGLLPTGGLNDTGVRATDEHVADLLVDDLGRAGATLRRDVPFALAALVSEGKLQQLGDEYRLQTSVGREWDQEFRSRRAAFVDDAATVAAARDAHFRAAVTALLPKAVAQGRTKVGRNLDVSFSDVEPVVPDKVPVWVRTGWDETEKQFDTRARAAGMDSALVLVFLPRVAADALKGALAELTAADETLQMRPPPTTDEGRQARRSMTSVRDASRARVDGLVADVLAEARVVQAGGASSTGGGLRSRVENAAGRAAERLFKRFGAADQPGWDKVVERARQGNAAPLEVLGHHDEVPKHPVAKDVLNSLNSGWTPGSAVVQHFTAAPYGWSLDAIRGALLALVACGEVAAQSNGQSVGPKDIAPTAIGKTTFRREKDTVTPMQRIELRAVLAKADVHVPSGDEVAGVARLIERLESQCRLVSGEPPVRELRPSKPLEALKSLHGNEQLLAVLAASDEIESFVSEIVELAKRAQARMPKYESAIALAAHARALDAAQSNVAHLDALRSSRSLLDEVDPISSVLQGLTDVLRAAIRAAYSNHRARLDDGLERLGQDSAWVALDDETRADVLTSSGLVPLDEPALSGPREVLAELAARPLAGWSDRDDALPSKLQRAREAAIRVITPDAVNVEIPRATLTDGAQVDAYVDALRTHLHGALAEHGSIVV